MKNNKIITAALFILLLTTFLAIANFVTGGKQITHTQPTQTSTPAALPNTPKTFQFNSSTDLKTELEKVNPQVLDSDF